MLIKVKTDEVDLKIPIPLGVILNRLTCAVAVKFINKEVQKETNNTSIEFSSAQLNAICREIKHARKALKDNPLLSVVADNGGTEVIITL